MTDIIPYKPNNEYMENVRKLLFENNIKFFFYLNNTYWEESTTTATEISYIISNHVGKLLDMDSDDAGVANGPDSLIIRNNNNYPTTAMNEALKSMINYLIALNEDYQKIFMIIMIVIICINVIVYPIVYFTQIKKLRENRYEVLQLMTTLPKTVISGISASLNKIKDEKTATQTMTITNTSSNPNYEQNRQEESIIKLFTSISDGTSKASIETSILILMIIIVALSCVSYYLGMNCFMVSSNNLVFNCHHINYLFGSVTYLFGVCARIFKVSLATCDESFKESILSIDDEIQNIQRILPYLVNYFQFIRLGGEDRREVPFSEMSTTINTASDLLTCTVGLTPPKTVMESVHCLTSAMQFIVSTGLMKKFYNNMLYSIYPDPRDVSLQQLWQIGPIELYQTFSIQQKKN
ncbi:hypothetical protein TVAG_431840 [Trichomonas vaginalis G3]|uniref:Uncharacterized protein n=1 Tax=Trichomonas vaginalis (strain ATCC PRA-98 / G3) TaxID=412133 RepID=A2F7Y1_TRIV3|nr:guanylate cyclase protein [Trichomonas vaginalis G3]EAX98975.1 hypothetical protein TVAG_431840 [Trichomonas vaginalis G3]KAI5507232.1 guanylate cyclase protein [Trichomonas vaginalis G3]|eukprot:XP_001311905.1 hypothetical protein [Trichomonas vaginalis G3]